MFKLLSYLFLTSILTISQSYAMHRDGRSDEARRRLQKKVEQRDSKDNESKKELQKLGETFFNTVMEMTPNEVLADHGPVIDIFSSIIDMDCTAKIFKSIENIKFTDQQVVDIKRALKRQGLDLAQTLIIKENFENSLKSGMKYQEGVNKLLNNECKFHNKIISNFPANQAFASDVLSFTHKSRKELILPLYIASDAALKILPRCTEHLKRKNLQNPRELLGMYVALFDVCVLCHSNSVSMLSSFDKDKMLRIKYRRLASSLFDGEIELFLSFSNLLLPYVKLIQNVLQVDGFDEVFGYKKIIEDVLDKQRKENLRGPVLLAKYKLFLQERARENNHPPLIKSTNLTPTPIQIELSSEKSDPLLDDPMEENHFPVNTNEKSKYRGVSEQEKTAERKRLAKEQKKANAVSFPSKDPEPKLSSEKEPKQPEIIEIGGGPFKIFNKIMDQSFKGTIEKVILLIEALGGSVDDGRSGSRIKIELPYINSNKRAYLDILPPEEEEECETFPIQPKTTTNTNTTTTTAESVIHTPHKGKSKKLRFYHTKDVRELLMDAGYTLDVVHKRTSQ